MTVIKFLSENYQTDGAIVEDGAIQVRDLSGGELVALYNILNSNMDIEKRIRKFSNKETGIKRVIAKLVKYDCSDEALPTTKPRRQIGKKLDALEIAAEAGKKAKKPQKRRGMRFVFRPESAIRECKGTVKSKSKDTRTLRQRAVALLSGNGATFSQVEAMVEKFDADRGVESKYVERRSYELVRLVHYYLGYGLKQEGNKIIAYSDPADAPKS